MACGRKDSAVFCLSLTVKYTSRISRLSGQTFKFKAYLIPVVVSIAKTVQSMLLPDLRERKSFSVLPKVKCSQKCAFPNCH